MTNQREVVADALPELLEKIALMLDRGSPHILYRQDLAAILRSVAPLPPQSAGVEARARELIADMRAHENNDRQAEYGEDDSVSIGYVLGWADKLEATLTQQQGGEQEGDVERPMLGWQVVDYVNRWKRNEASADNMLNKIACHLDVCALQPANDYNSGYDAGRTAALRTPASEGDGGRGVDVLCIWCGTPTMHTGNICFFCSKAATEAALVEAIPYVESHAEASHMLEGFRRGPDNRHDALVARMKQITRTQEKVHAK